MRLLALGIVLLLLGIPTFLIANAHQPESNCKASQAACEHDQGVSPVPGRFSENTYETVYNAGLGAMVAGFVLLLAGFVLLLAGVALALGVSESE